MRLVVLVDEEMHRGVRVAAAERNWRVADVVRAAVGAWLARANDGAAAADPKPELLEPLRLEEKNAAVREILERTRPSALVSGLRGEEAAQACMSCGSSLVEKQEPRTGKKLMLCPFCSI